MPLSTLLYMGFVRKLIEALEELYMFIGTTFFCTWENVHISVAEFSGRRGHESAMAADSEPPDNPTVPRLFVGQIGGGIYTEHKRYSHPLGIVRGARVLRPQQSGQSGTFRSHMAATRSNTSEFERAFLMKRQLIASCAHLRNIWICCRIKVKLLIFLNSFIILKIIKTSFWFKNEFSFRSSKSEKTEDFFFNSEVVNFCCPFHARQNTDILRMLLTRKYLLCLKSLFADVHHQIRQKRILSRIFVRILLPLTAHVVWICGASTESELRIYLIY